VTDWIRPGTIPRFSSPIEYTIARKLFAQKRLLGHFVCHAGNYHVYYTRKLSWFVQVTPFKPLLLDEHGKRREPSELKVLHFATQLHAHIAFAALNSTLFYWFLTTGSDCRNLNKREVCGLPLAMDTLDNVLQTILFKLAHELEQSLQAHAKFQVRQYPQGSLTIQCIFPIHSRPVIDQIDRVLAQHYGFTPEEIDFLINYDGKYRNQRIRDFHTYPEGSTQNGG
jgi:hypothetical protein